MITASLTTIPERTKSLKDTVNSLLPQVDKLNVFLHGYTTVPKFLKNEKIEVVFDLEYGDHGDLDKMRWCDEVTGYHLVCDDDLIYPSDYAKQMVRAINKYKRKAIVSYHGANIWQPPIAQYYQDRDAFPCLGTVEKDKEVDIVGTGVMGYYSSVGLKKFDLNDKMPNMLDLHIAIWAKQQKVPMYVLKHKEGWIKHSAKVDLNKTIYAQAVKNDFIQTNLINKNSSLFRKPKQMLRGFPIVTVVVVNSRGHSMPHIVKACLDSLRNQSYPNIEVIVVENYARLMTIGKAFNDAIKKAAGEWIFFLGDDDLISYDYIQSLVTYASSGVEPNIAGVTSYLTMFSSMNGVQNSEPRELVPTGMWKRDYLLKYPFSEFLTRYVDTDMMDSCTARGDKYGIVRWHYGYFYRSHTDQVSGHKALVLQDKYASWRTDDVKRKLRELNMASVTIKEE